MRWWKSVLMVAVAALWPLAAPAEERVLTLQPEKTSVTFTLRATGHEVHGVLALASGQIRFDPGTGSASGQVAFDLRRTATGNGMRDREMHAKVLESERYPLLVFRAERVEGALAASGRSEVTLHGVVALHGAEHRLAVPVRVRASGERLTAESVFDVPYVEWGLHDPSVLFLRVAPVVAVTVKAEAEVRGATASTGHGPRAPDGPAAGPGPRRDGRS